MKKIAVILIIAFMLLPLPVNAMEIEAPVAPNISEEYMPDNTESFAEGVWYILKTAIKDILPEIYETAGLCLSVFAVMLLTSLVDSFTGVSGKVLHLASAVSIGLILMNPANALIRLGAETVSQMSEYGNLLIPVLTGALAAQGGVTSSTALYAITAFFGSVFTTMIKKFIVPMIYIYYCLCLVNGAIGEQIIKNLQNYMKWLITWALKILLYAFTGFIGITGVVSGSADASTVKALKLTISGMVPLVGGIISDASETILVSAGVMKSAAGVYGLLAIFAIFIAPFLKIGAQYILLKFTAALCSVFAEKRESDLLNDFSGGLGMLLAMTGTVCLFLLIAVVCFMKGVS